MTSTPEDLQRLDRIDVLLDAMGYEAGDSTRLSLAAARAALASLQVEPAKMKMLTEALDIALDALDEIALAGMSYGERGVDQDVIDRFHAGRAWFFISVAARAKERSRAAKNGLQIEGEE